MRHAVDSTLNDIRQSAKAGILVVVPDDSVRRILLEFLGDAGYFVEAVKNSAGALEAVRQSSVDLVVTDLLLPDIDGIELLYKLQHVDNRLLGMVLADGTVTSAIRTARAGMFDVITKPFDLDAMGASIQRALEFRRLKEENGRLRSAVREEYRFQNLVGNSAAMGAVHALVENVAATDSPVLIVGENGTEKELVAQTIHYNSRRRDKPLIRVNCGAIPEHLLAGELLGREGGAFTGSAAARIGRFERANGGTVFLDDVTEMSVLLQGRLVKLLQERSFERAGGRRTIHVDIRVIAATSRNLEQAVANKQFRDDLSYRFNVAPIVIPPLRERRSDIPLLVERTLATLRQNGQGGIDGVSFDAIHLLEQYTWPGNVRELENVLERIAMLKRRGMIGPQDVPDDIRRGAWSRSRSNSGNNTPDAQHAHDGEESDIAAGMVWEQDGGQINLSKSVDEFETRLIMEALRRSNGVKSRAARLLRMNRTTLVEKLKKKGISNAEE